MKMETAAVDNLASKNMIGFTQASRKERISTSRSYVARSSAYLNLNLGMLTFKIFLRVIVTF